jgi:polyisoprenyl-phosphate glycosyltransferase
LALAYDRDARFAGESAYSYRKLLRLAFDGITGFSIAPLRLASYLGFLMGIAGVVLLIDVFIEKWFNHTDLPGWTSLMIVVLGIGSVQLMVAGVMGEYLGRLYLETKRRPLYVVQDLVRGGKLVAPRKIEIMTDRN